MLPPAPVRAALHGMKRSLGWLVVVLVVACLFVARDFVGTVVLAAFMVTTFHPLHQRLATRTGPKWSALALTTAIVVVIMAPLVFVSVVLSGRVVELIDELV